MEVNLCPLRNLGKASCSVSIFKENFIPEPENELAVVRLDNSEQSVTVVCSDDGIIQVKTLTPESSTVTSKDNTSIQPAERVQKQVNIVPQPPRECYIINNDQVEQSSVDDKEQISRCSLCNLEFQSVKLYDDHLKTHCSDTINQCPICMKSFKERVYLLMHLRTHSGYKVYKCSQCSKAFIQPGNLKTHERTHTGVKPYQCRYCLKTFTRSTGLKRHEPIHTGARPYECSYCNKTFTLKCNLKEHERIHTGVKPFKCTCCDKAFAQASSLKYHQRSAHPATI